MITGDREREIKEMIRRLEARCREAEREIDELCEIVDRLCARVAYLPTADIREQAGGRLLVN